MFAAGLDFLPIPWRLRTVGQLKAAAKFSKTTEIFRGHLLAAVG